jgi:hypothetical protein
VSRYANGACIGNGAEMAHHLSLEEGLPACALVDRSLMRGRGGLIEDCYIPRAGGLVHTKIRSPRNTISRCPSEVFSFSEPDTWSCIIYLNLRPVNEMSLCSFCVCLRLQTRFQDLIRPLEVDMHCPIASLLSAG